MDESTKKTALRMIPYGLYVMTAEDEDGRISAATVNLGHTGFVQTAPGSSRCQSRFAGA